MSSPAPKAVTLGLLQGFRLEHEGGNSELPLGIQRLVAFLAIHNRPLLRLFVAGSLWIDSSEEHANANLRTALWRLHRVAAYEQAAIVEREHLEPASARLLPHPLDLDKICRYEAHLTRQLYQALHELEALRAAQRGRAVLLVRVDV